MSPSTAYKNTEYMKTFFGFCHDSKIMTAGAKYGTKPANCPFHC